MTDLYASSYAPSEKVSIVTPLFDTNLLKVVRSMQLTAAHRKDIMVSVCRGLAYMHKYGVVHRDIKPANILLNQNMECAIADHGFARYLPDGGHRRPSVHDDNSPLKSARGGTCGVELSTYCVTRWYRPPELLCNRPMYNTTVDSWSVGCVLAEMICQAALLPGKTANDQMFRIVQLLGPPNEAERCAVCPDLETNRIIRAVRDHWPGMSATERLRRTCRGKAEHAEVDLIVRLLAFDPAKRIRVKEALDHPFLHQHHREYRGPDRAPPPPQSMEVEMAFEAACDGNDPTKVLAGLRSYVTDEVLRYQRHHQEARPWLDRAPGGKITTTGKTARSGRSSSVEVE